MTTYKATALAALLVLSMPAFADDWTTEDTYWEVAYQTVHILDWGQTRYIATSPDYYETNPLLGRNPTLAEVDRHFLIGGVGHYLISKWLPPKYRRVWQSVSFVYQAQYPIRNHSMGIKIKF